VTARRPLRAVAALVVLVTALAACNVVDLGGATALTVAADGTVPVTVRCTGAKACAGSVRVRVGGLDSPFRSFTAPAGGSKQVVVTLTAAQRARLSPTGATAAEVRIKESKPVDLAVRSLPVTLGVAAPPAPPESTAYRERSWTPTAFDTCPASLHRTYSVIGPDGKLYPTWHPPTVVDPATGQTCTFGHEHGDDPATSDLYEWVTDHLDASLDRGRGIPFGYVSEALDAWSASTGAVTRHEDNVGHKIVVANDVRQVTASPRGYVRDGSGAIVTCDVLMKVHQGSHSGDALVNNAHELLYAARCTDGTEVISSTMTRFGDANEFKPLVRRHPRRDGGVEPARRRGRAAPDPRPGLHRPRRPGPGRAELVDLGPLRGLGVGQRADEGRRHRAGVVRPVVRGPQPGPGPRRRGEQPHLRPGRRHRHDRRG
jgi:hypothetical protein